VAGTGADGAALLVWFPVLENQDHRGHLDAGGFGLLLIFACLTSACITAPALESGRPWEVLFDPASTDPLAGWQATAFGGQGEVELKDDTLVLNTGYPLTGITRVGSLPQVPFELEATCRRRVGNDFFCGLTFPVREGHLTLILGGWGGATCGLSSLDGADASENATCFYLWTPPDQTVWVRLVVESERVRLWLDGNLRLTQDLKGVRCSVRPEMLPCLPLGFACFSTSAELDGLRVRAFKGS